MGQGHRLGPGGRAGGEEQDRHGFRIDRLLEIVAPTGCQERAAAGEQAFEGQPVFGILREPHVDDMPEAGRFPCDRAHDLALGFGTHHRGRLGPLEAAQDLLLGQFAVDRHHDPHPVYDGG